jgi:hypothetical protein
MTLLLIGSILFALRGEDEIVTPAGQKTASGQKIIIEVINRHFTVGKRIPSVYLRVFSDGTAECHTEKFWDEADVTKTKVLGAMELEKLRAVINEPHLLDVKPRYELMHFVVDSWMEWDIKIQHPGSMQKIRVVSFSPDSARERSQPYPDALVKLGCSILKIRNDVYGDARTYSKTDCPDFPSIQ